MSNFNRVAFFKAVGWQPRMFQAQIHDCPARFRALSCGVRTGKTSFSAYESLAMFFTPHSPEYPIWLIANNYENVDAIFHLMYWTIKRSFTDVLERASLKYRVLTLKDGRQVNCRSAEEAAGLEAKGVFFMVVDESRDIRNAIWDERLQARLLDTNGRALLLTSGCKKRGDFNWFYNVAKTGVPHHYKDKPCKCTPDTQVAYFQYASTENPMISKEEFEKIRQRVPEYVFRERYEGNMIDTDICLFPNMDEIFVAKEEEPIKDVPYVAGLDLALRRDLTVLSIFNAKTATEVKKVILPRNVDWEYIAKQAGMWLHLYNNAICYADETGTGSGCVQLMRKARQRVKGISISTRGIRNTLIEDLISRFTNISIFLIDEEKTKEEYNNLQADLQNSITPNYKFMGAGSPDRLMAQALANQLLTAMEGDSRPIDVRSSGSRVNVPSEVRDTVSVRLALPRSGADGLL
jgi:hypothetical protein